MSKKNFLERMAKHAFVFAAVLAASVALSSCSKDDDNTKKEETVEVQPNSAVIDGKLWKLTNPEYHFFDGNNNTSYALLLYIGNTRSYISIDGDGGKYNGKTIDLTKTEEEFADRAYNWKVVCVDPGSNNWFFAGCALEKMFEGGDYVDYVRYKGARLTVKGILFAERLIRTHKIWEVFLVQSLGFSPDEVHAQAEVLEHASSPELINRLVEFLDDPTHCPHGEIIPTIHEI